MSKLVKKDIPRECKECTKEFLVSVKNNKKMFCSIDCANKHHNRIKCEVLRDAKNRRQDFNEIKEGRDIKEI